MVEFTGERVIPGEVEVDLWNEHVARYAFAARFAAGKRVLDAGCGAGYGSAELARTAHRVTGADCAADAVRFARGRYRRHNVEFLQSSCASLPLPDGSIDLVVAFEVIEHVADWQGFLREARRVLAPAGQLIISTPNKEYYAESRRRTGPNPFHVHEFGFDEFQVELQRRFPHVLPFVQNHVEGIAFTPLGRGAAGLVPQVQEGDGKAEPRLAHFFLAVCGLAAEPEASAFLYLPSAANILREREVHIERLEGELATKDGWLAELRREKHEVIEMFREQKTQLDQSNLWAQELDQKLSAAQDRIVALQQELERTSAGYEAKVGELERENREKTEWAQRVDAELAECARLLDAAEKTVEERTAWALRLEAQLNAIRASRWFKLARKIGLVSLLKNDSHA